ncbi:unnamed protein product [Boreogadus saida]
MEKLLSYGFHFRLLNSAPRSQMGHQRRLVGGPRERSHGRQESHQEASRPHVVDTFSARDGDNHHAGGGSSPSPRHEPVVLRLASAAQIGVLCGGAALSVRVPSTVSSCMFIASMGKTFDSGTAGLAVHHAASPARRLSGTQQATGGWRRGGGGGGGGVFSRCVLMSRIRRKACDSFVRCRPSAVGLGLRLVLCRAGRGLQLPLPL